MARRRDTMAPYEIMGQQARGGAPVEPGPTDEPAGEPRPGFAESLWDLWDAGVPVVVRVPRGLVALVCVGVLALIVLAYFVGYSRGASATEARLLEEASQAMRTGRVPTAGRLVEVSPEAAAAPRATGDGAAAEEAPLAYITSGGGDPRQVGLNYLILARYPRSEAERLGRFLSGRGVETALIPTDNAGLFHVVALRGVTTEQYRAGTQAEFENRMRQLGRDWQAFNEGKGGSLSDMYWRLYTGS